MHGQTGCAEICCRQSWDCNRLCGQQAGKAGAPKAVATSCLLGRGILNGTAREPGGAELAGEPACSALRCVQMTQQARQVLAACEKSPADTEQLNYDPRNPFDICSLTFTPIYRGNKVGGWLQFSFRVPAPTLGGRRARCM